MTVFTEILKALAGYSVALEAGTASDGDFTRFQRLESRILTEYQNNRLGEREKSVLNHIAIILHANFRRYLKLDR